MYRSDGHRAVLADEALCDLRPSLQLVDPFGERFPMVWFCGQSQQPLQPVQHLLGSTSRHRALLHVWTDPAMRYLFLHPDFYLLRPWALRLSCPVLSFQVLSLVGLLFAFSLPVCSECSLLFR